MGVGLPAESRDSQFQNAPQQTIFKQGVISRHGEGKRSEEGKACRVPNPAELGCRVKPYS